MAKFDDISIMFLGGHSHTEVTPDGHMGQDPRKKKGGSLILLGLKRGGLGAHPRHILKRVTPLGGGATTSTPTSLIISRVL